MKKIRITCPFTGLPFDAVKYEDGRIVATNKITGDDIMITYNAASDRYMIRPDAFASEPTMTMTDAAKTLGVSKARISVLAKQGRLRAFRPGAQMYITRESVLDYKRRQQAKGADDGAGTN